MEILNSIGERLREERVSLGKTQDEFAAIAAAANVPGATRQSQAKYEKGQTAPSATYMNAIAAAGADVLYIITGERGGLVLSQPEREMLGYYRDASVEVRRAALGALVAGRPLAAQAARDVNMTNSGAGAVQVGLAGGDVTVKGSE